MKAYFCRSRFEGKLVEAKNLEYPLSLLEEVLSAFIVAELHVQRPDVVDHFRLWIHALHVAQQLNRFLVQLQGLLKEKLFI